MPNGSLWRVLCLATGFVSRQLFLEMYPDEQGIPSDNSTSQLLMLLPIILQQFSALSVGYAVASGGLLDAL
ncbi:hypothetical protein NC652_013540 [Populus alba x Populus x berolinensis]|nr:hypothetical protein NC652_013540 [Populus alba x Populus x berolinensis]